MAKLAARKRVEDQLRKLSRAVEQNPASIVITNVTGAIEYVNPKFTEVTGYTVDEVRGENSRLLKSGELSAEEYQLLWRTILQGREWHGEFHNRKKSGELFWEAATISPIKADDGKITHFVAVKEDITERKQAEAALRKREEQYRRLFEDMLGGIMLLEVLCDGHENPVDHRLLEANSAFEQMTGLKRSEEIGRTSADLSIKLPPEVARRYYRVALEGQPLHWERFNESLQRHYDVRAFSPAKGQCAIVFYDITARLRAEEAMRENEARFQQLANSITDVFWLISPDLQKVHYVSPGYERIWGRSSASLYAHPQQWIEAILPEDRERVLADFSRLTNRESEISVEYRVARPDGMVRWVLERGYRVLDAAGKVIRLTGLTSDTTERKMLEWQIATERERLEHEVLRHLEKEQERIGRDLHDGLCQVLVGAKYRTGVLVKRLADMNPASAVAAAKVVEKMINSTIQQARDLAKGLNPVKLEVNGLVFALEELAKEVESTGITHCHFRLCEDTSVSDRNVANHLYRITQEAVQNAIKHGKAEKISIALRERGGQLILNVEDNGVGFLANLEHPVGAGLHNMRMRASMIGGVLAIRPGRRRGSVISVSLPAKASQG